MKNKLILILMLIPFVISWGYSGEVPMETQTELILKIISMDRNFSRFGDPVKIGTSSQKLLQVLSTNRGRKIKDKSFVVGKLKSLNDINNYRVIYIGKNWAKDYEAASAIAEKNQALVFCETEDGVMGGGGAVSFRVVGNKAKIVINLKNARKQGSDFPLGFLKGVVVIDQMP